MSFFRGKGTCQYLPTSTADPHTARGRNRQPGASHERRTDVHRPFNLQQYRPAEETRSSLGMAENFPDPVGASPATPLGIGFHRRGRWSFPGWLLTEPPPKSDLGRTPAVLRRQVRQTFHSPQTWARVPYPWPGFVKAVTCTTAICLSLKEVVHFYNTRAERLSRIIRQRTVSPGETVGESENAGWPAAGRPELTKI